MTASVSERVRAGFALLDEKKPGWYTRINLHVLSVASTIWCPLGQTYGSEGDNGFVVAAQELFDNDFRGLCGHGFAAKFDKDVFTEYRKLTAEWKRQIEARLLSDRVTGEALAAAETYLGIGADEWDCLMPSTHLVGLG
jgi:hypothetical protein